MKILASVEEKALNGFLKKANGMFALSPFNTQTKKYFNKR